MKSFKFAAKDSVEFHLMKIGKGKHDQLLLIFDSYHI